ncbi:membrane-anchored junction protein [Myotis myotis]|uniref:membrane-anchored junction protein n=1 Tax=Myotis myotis TaxID=51298 RepID=UPI00174E6364|nr:membrane-anchored junction protein [Myotis myotis]
MSLKPFTYPFPETRFLHSGSSVYKFKIRYGDSIRGEDVENKEVIVQELEVPAERKAARVMKKKRKRMELSVSPSRPGLDRATMRTSSQGPSRKKFLMETSRNMERNTQQKCQETPAFDGTDVQEQGSRWEDSLAGEITPPLQQSNPPPPAGPTGLGTSGFFGFLSSLFPFRYFFRKSSHWGGEKRRGGLLRKGLGPEGEASGCRDWRTRDKLHLQPLPYRPKLSLLHKAAERHNPESGDLSASD